MATLHQWLRRACKNVSAVRTDCGTDVVLWWSGTATGEELNLTGTIFSDIFSCAKKTRISSPFSSVRTGKALGDGTVKHAK